MRDEEESIEEKKARMRLFMKADRQLEKARTRPGRRGGCLFGLIKLTLVVGAVAGIIYLIWLWHPWGYEYEEFDALEQPGICAPGVGGSKSVQYLTIFGQRVDKVDEAVICVE